VHAGILIVDDNTAVRTTLRTLLEWHSFQICGEARNGQEAVEKVKHLKPQLVLLDINMPEMNGITAAVEIRRVSPETKIVFLTVHDSQNFKAASRPFGHAFVSKAAAGTELIPALDRLISN
jgi:two-component system, NarL family, response regulator NreC